MRGTPLAVGLAALTCLLLAPAAAGQEGRACPAMTSSPSALPAAAVRTLVERAGAANSDALVILRDGELVGEWYFGRERAPIQTMSATKSVVSMAIGRLLATGALDSLGVPVSQFYPEWRQGRKREVTVRMLLDHTSGLQNVQNAGAEIYPAPDAVRLALAAELSHAPGTHFSYNNKAVNLLAGVVERAAGVPLDEYVRRELLDPLCITPGSWYRDAAGNPHAMAGLELAPLDLARLGQLMLAGGVWRGERLLTEDWVRESLTPSQPFAPSSGLLWWLTHEWTRYTVDAPLLERWRDAGVEPAFVEAMQPLVGRVFDGAGAFNAALDSIFGEGRGRPMWAEATTERGVPGRTFTVGPVRAFSAEGFLGQHLVVLPAERIVAVRMKRSGPDHRPEHNLSDFADLVVQLFGRGNAGGRTP